MDIYVLRDNEWKKAEEVELRHGNKGRVEVGRGVYVKLVYLCDIWTVYELFFFRLEGTEVTRLPVDGKLTPINILRNGDWSGWDLVVWWGGDFHIGHKVLRCIEGVKVEIVVHQDALKERDELLNRNGFPCNKMWNGSNWEPSVEVKRDGEVIGVAHSEVCEGDIIELQYTIERFREGRWVRICYKNELGECREVKSDREVRGSSLSESNLPGMKLSSVIANLGAIGCEEKVLELDEFKVVAQASGKLYVVVDSGKSIGSPDEKVLSRIPGVRVVYTEAQGDTNACGDDTLVYCASLSGEYTTYALVVEGQAGPHLVTVVECNSSEQVSDVIQRVHSGQCDIPDAREDAWDAYKEMFGVTTQKHTFTTTTGANKLLVVHTDPSGKQSMQVKDPEPSGPVLVLGAMGSGDMPFCVPRRWNDPKDRPDDFGGDGGSSGSGYYNSLPENDLAGIVTVGQSSNGTDSDSGIVK